VLNPLFRLVGRLGERELFIVAGLFTVVGAAAVMHSLHLSVPLGAFVAGVMLAESPYRHEIESDVEPFRSILLGLFFLSVGMRLADWLARREERSADGLDGPEKSPETSAIVVGYGRFGQPVAQMMQAKGIGVTIIDKKPSMIETAEEFGTKVYYGDGLRLDLLRTAGAETAKVIAFCNDNEGGEMTRDAVKAVLKAFPQASVMVRAFDRVHLMKLDGLDLAFAQRELFESAMKMGRAALKASGIDVGEVDRVERAYRLRDCERLELQSSTGDLHAGI